MGLIVTTGTISLEIGEKAQAAGLFSLEGSVLNNSPLVTYNSANELFEIYFQLSVFSQNYTADDKTKNIFLGYYYDPLNNSLSEISELNGLNLSLPGEARKATLADLNNDGSNEIAFALNTEDGRDYFSGDGSWSSDQILLFTKNYEAITLGEPRYEHSVVAIPSPEAGTGHLLAYDSGIWSLDESTLSAKETSLNLLDPTNHEEINLQNIQFSNASVAFFESQYIVMSEYVGYRNSSNYTLNGNQYLPTEFGTVFSVGQSLGELQYLSHIPSPSSQQVFTSFDFSLDNNTFSLAPLLEIENKPYALLGNFQNDIYEHDGSLLLVQQLTLREVVEATGLAFDYFGAPVDEGTAAPIQVFNFFEYSENAIKEANFYFPEGGIHEINANHSELIDINGDGFLDFAIYSVTGDLQVFINDGLGGLANTELSSIFPTADFLSDGGEQRLKDLDFDGDADLITMPGGWNFSTDRTTLDDFILEIAFNNSVDAIGVANADQAGRRFFNLESDQVFKGGYFRDVVELSGAQSNYNISLSKDITSITDRRMDGDGTDTLINIELLDFEADLLEQPFDLRQVSGATDLTNDEFESLIELYIAYFNRAPASKGLLYWADRLAEGMELPQIAESFFVQTETQSTYQAYLNADGSLNNTEAFVNAVFNNVLGRDPTGPYWVNELDNNPDITPAIFILAVLSGAKAASGSPADAAYLADKTDIGVYFSAIKGLSDYDDTIAVMDLYDGSAASIDAAVAAIDEIYADALDPINGEFLMQLVGVLDDPFAIA